MKKIIIFLGLWVWTYAIQAQTVSDLLSGKNWVFDSVYTKEAKILSAKEQNFYTGLFRSATYSFSNNGKYTLERPKIQPISGKWTLEDKDQFLFLQSETGKGKRYKIIELKENRLILEDLSSQTAIAYKLVE